MLARATTHKVRGVGELLLLMSALERTLAASLQIGSTAVVVDAKDEAATNFYASYGFIRLPEHPNRLFLPISDGGNDVPMRPIRRRLAYLRQKMVYPAR